MVDVYGERDGAKIIEIEEKRRAPLQNVAKIIRWVYRSERTGRVTMIHVFSREFYGKSENRAEEELAKFVGNLGRKVLDGRFEYIPLRVSMLMSNRSDQTRNAMRDVARYVLEESVGQ